MSAIEFRKRFSKCMIPMAKFSSRTFIHIFLKSLMMTNEEHLHQENLIINTELLTILNY